MSEIEGLQRAFGITPLEALPDDKPMQGVAFVDRTDYSALLRGCDGQAEGAAAAGPMPVANRPLWRVR